MNQQHLNAEDWPFQAGWASYSPLRVHREQRQRREEFSLGLSWTTHLPSPPGHRRPWFVDPQTQTRSRLASWVSGPQAWTELYHQLPWASSLQMAEAGLLSLHDRRNQSLMVKTIGSVSLEDPASGSLLVQLPSCHPPHPTASSSPPSASCHQIGQILSLLYDLCCSFCRDAFPLTPHTPTYTSSPP